MFSFRSQNKRRSQSTGSGLVAADVLESRQLLSATTQLHADLVGSGAATGTGEYSVSMVKGVSQRTFEAEVVKGAANTTYPVSINGVVVGQLLTNANGRGELEFKDSPKSGQHAFPANFPSMAIGTSVSVDGLVSGTIASGAGSSNEGGGNDGNDANDHNDGNDGGVDGGTGLHSVLTGTAGQTGTANFTTKTENGVVNREFTLNAQMLTAGTSYPVTLGGVNIGTITANSLGVGQLILADVPLVGESAFPAGFVAPSVNSKVAVGTVLTGNLATGGLDDDGADGEKKDGGVDGEKKDGSIKNKDKGLHAALTGTGTAIGTANFTTETEHGVVNREFTVNAQNLTPGTSYPVTLGGVSLGTITANSLGFGQLRLADAPKAGETAFPAGFVAPIANSKVALETVLTGTMTTSTGSRDGSTLQIDLTGTGTMTGRMEFEQKLTTTGAVTKSEFEVDIWNGVPGTVKNVTVDGIVVGTMTINARGYGKLRLTSAAGLNSYPANWPGIKNGSVVAVGTDVTGTVNTALPVAAAQLDATAARYTAASLTQNLSLKSTSNYFENWGKTGEKWVQGKSGWYFITPDGQFYKWNGSKTATGTLITTLDTSYYTNPTLLTGAMNSLTTAETAVAVDRGLDLVATTAKTNVFLNWGGKHEKWVKGANNAWYFITPDGSLYAWNHAKSATGTLVTKFSTSFYANPQSLTSAVTVADTAHEAILDAVFASYGRG